MLNSGSIATAEPLCEMTSRDHALRVQIRAVIGMYLSECVNINIYIHMHLSLFLYYISVHICM